MRESYFMVNLIYRCPNTDRMVHVWVAAGADSDSVPASAGETYDTVKCLACGQLHLVNPATGRVLSRDPR
jgi:hypothetical protein